MAERGATTSSSSSAAVGSSPRMAVIDLSASATGAAEATTRPSRTLSAVASDASGVSAREWASPERKRAKTGPGSGSSQCASLGASAAGGLRPELLFRELDIDRAQAQACGLQWPSRVEAEKISAHADSNHNVFVSDTNRIVCFRPDGSCHAVVSGGIEPHHIVPNSSNDYVVALRKSDKQRLWKVNMDGTVETILNSQTPLYGPDVCLNGDVVHHPTMCRLERRNPAGELMESIDGGRGKVISFEANSYLTAGQDGYVYFTSRTCVYRWNNKERTVECIAGHAKAAGRRDGFGSDARFTHLKRPVLTRRYAYVRESDNRFCRVNLSTFEVSTLHLRGVDPAGIETYGVTSDGAKMFLIFVAPQLRIFIADTADLLESTFTQDMRRVDWTGARGARVHVELIAGPERKVFQADGRILEARSAYFRSMLTGGLREAKRDGSAEPIDLGEDVPGDALLAVLHFLHTDQFDLLDPSQTLAADAASDEDALRLAKLALQVHALADRFLLSRLARLCEVFLAEVALRPSLVLPLLASLTSPCRRPNLAGLEAACWAFVEANWKEIVQNHNSTLQELVEQGHPLALELLRSASGVRRGASKPEDETPAACGSLE
eukprot:TRINITY_DN15553_c0_g2_i2.p1 TRINITY_DN15553_c0_g2~~TRINITY_DN15553_c0_g2_i2.p1  ORF type:complete len:633 (+),score=125.27 TRINITY_DN15553_c0_g2_i2:76-1899(+)